MYKLEYIGSNLNTVSYTSASTYINPYLYKLMYIYLYIGHPRNDKDKDRSDKIQMNGIYVFTHNYIHASG